MKKLFFALLSVVTMSAFAQIEVTTNGNVGVGTSSPVHKLQIHDSIVPTLAIGKLNENTNGASRLYFYAGDDTLKNGFQIQYNKTVSTDYLGFIDGGLREVLTIQNGGNIGIGTTNPDNKLVVETGSNTYIKAHTTSSTGTSGLILTGARDQAGTSSHYIRTTGEDHFHLSIEADENMYFKNNNTTSMFLTASGDLGIGTTITHGRKLAVDGNGTFNGNVEADDFLVYPTDLTSPWPDYVFEKEYELLPIKDVEKHIEEKGHLPNIPSAKEVEEKGSFSLGEMNKKLLEKVEELTLYLIDQNKRMEKQEQRIKALEAELVNQKK
jgi:hypothetical protein